MSKVECPSCHKHVHPRLWHYTPWYGWFTYMKTQHMCNLCGTVMYESGGGLRGGLVIFCAICIAPFAYIIFSLAGPGKIGVGILEMALGLLQIYLMYLVFRWISNKFKRAPKTPLPFTENTDEPAQPKETSSAAIDTLERLALLKERGLLTPEEFDREKQKILS